MYNISFFFLLSSLSFSQIIIGEGLTGDLLLDYVVSNYKTSTTLGYNTARDTLYGNIDLQEDNQLSCVYSGYSITLDTSVDPSTNAYSQGINCEHTWPQSMGAGNEPQKSDLHHLYPCKSNVNSSRGNHPYDEIPDEETDTWYRNDYSQETIPTEFIDEYAEKNNTGDATFEPREDHKGDAARAMFYFFAMYEDAADTNFWNIQKDVLLEWHQSDLVDDWELNRTWLIAEYQENQPNPFVLDSSLARRIWFVNSYDNNYPPGEFSLVMPEQNTILQSMSPQFMWTTAFDSDPMDTVHYTLILDTPHPGIIEYYAGTDTAFTLPDTLEDNTEYFWQVIAEDRLGMQTINNGGYVNFYTNVENEPPSEFELLSPNHNSIQSDLSPNFSWTASMDPDPLDSLWYRLEIFGPMVAYYFWQYIATTTETNYTPDFSLFDNSRFSYLVTVNDQFEQSYSTQEYIFYTDSIPEPPLNFSTIYPGNNSNQEDMEIDFTWNQTFDPDPLEQIHYQIVYATDWEDSSTYVFSAQTQDTVLTILLENNHQYYWMVNAFDLDGFTVGSNNNLPNTFLLGVLTNSENIIVPDNFALYQNYPNPFNPTTTVKYELPISDNVNIVIINLAGFHIRSLINKKHIAGSYLIDWDGTNDLGKAMPTGTYFCVMMTDNFQKIIKMILLK